MSDHWELTENPSKYHDYHWYSDELPERKYYLFITEIARRVRHIMTNPGTIKMIDFCEQRAEGGITQNELSSLSHKHWRSTAFDPFVGQAVNDFFWWVLSRKNKAHAYTGVNHAAEVFGALAAIDAGILSPQAQHADIPGVRDHPIFATVVDRIEQEWGCLVRDIFGVNPFYPVTLDPSWRTPTVTALARQMYDSRDFSPMQILADALQDAGCDHADVLGHCRGPGPHVRGCWVVDCVLGES